MSIPGVDHWYACVAELTAGQARWDVARDRCRERHRMYEALGLITKGIQMSNTIKTAEGVLEAGPDEPALAAATQREENSRAAAMEDLRSSEEIDREWSSYLTRCGEFGEAPLSRSVWEERTRCAGLSPAGGIVTKAGPGDRRTTPTPLFSGGPVGRVSPEQAGILPTGPMQVTNEMVYRAQTELVRHENPTGASAVRAALKAALTG